MLIIVFIPTLLWVIFCLLLEFFIFHFQIKLLGTQVWVLIAYMSQSQIVFNHALICQIININCNSCTLFIYPSHPVFMVVFRKKIFVLLGAHIAAPCLTVSSKITLSFWTGLFDYLIEVVLRVELEPWPPSKSPIRPFDFLIVVNFGSNSELKG